jgi:hypothetical protein
MSGLSGLVHRNRRLRSPSTKPAPINSAPSTSNGAAELPVIGIPGLVDTTVVVVVAIGAVVVVVDPCVPIFDVVVVRKVVSLDSRVVGVTVEVVDPAAVSGVVDVVELVGAVELVVSVVSVVDGGTVYVDGAGAVVEDDHVGVVEPVGAVVAGPVVSPGSVLTTTSVVVVVECHPPFAWWPVAPAANIVPANATATTPVATNQLATRTRRRAPIRACLCETT